MKTAAGILTIGLLTIALHPRAAISADCLSLINSGKSVSEIMDCVRQQDAETSELRRQTKGASQDLNAAERRLRCARLALKTARGRIADANKYVDLAAKTSSNHALRNQMLVQWRGPIQSGVWEKLGEVEEFLLGKRASC